MRQYHLTTSPEDIKREFAFLIDDYGYRIIDEDLSNYGPSITYQRENIKIYLYYDYRDNFFSFKIIRGKNTPFPNDLDTENIKTFWDLAEKYIPGIDFKTLNPNDLQYMDALKLNAEILKKYGQNILKEEEWF